MLETFILNCLSYVTIKTLQKLKNVHKLLFIVTQNNILHERINVNLQSPYYIESLVANNDLRYLQKIDKAYFNNQTLPTIAIKNENLQMFTFLCNNHCPLENDICKMPIDNDRIDLIKAIFRVKLTRDNPKNIYWDTHYAVKRGKLNLVKLITTLPKLYWASRTLTKKAAKYMQLDIMKLLYQQSVYWDCPVMTIAVKNNDFELVQYLYENDCPFEFKVIQLAAENGCISLLRYFMKQNSFSLHSFTTEELYCLLPFYLSQRKYNFTIQCFVKYCKQMNKATNKIVLDTI